jgi:hypothetical protein
MLLAKTHHRSQAKTLSSHTLESMRASESALHMPLSFADRYSGARLGSIIGRIARRLPSPVEQPYEEPEVRNIATGGKAPTTLRAAVRVFSGISQLSEEKQQEFWVAVEIEGALHNRALLPETTIDVIFVVNNA